MCASCTARSRRQAGICRGAPDTPTRREAVADKAAADVPRWKSALVRGRQHQGAGPGGARRTQHAPNVEREEHQHDLAGQPEEEALQPGRQQRRGPGREPRTTSSPAGVPAGPPGRRPAGTVPFRHCCTAGEGLHWASRHGGGRKEAAPRCGHRSSPLLRAPPAARCAAA